MMTDLCLPTLRGFWNSLGDGGGGFGPPHPSLCLRSPRGRVVSGGLGTGSAFGWDSCLLFLGTARGSAGFRTPWRSLAWGLALVGRGLALVGRVALAGGEPDGWLSP